jgi:hypothetical protein
MIAMENAARVLLELSNMGASATSILCKPDGSVVIHGIQWPMIDPMSGPMRQPAADWYGGGNG